ncbi:MAG: gluconolactonase [Limisphaerales bacterium]|nr:MAG: gluconolactonase [Limisphaerales bacterium]KAG0507136.1 MAG: gluconolactonase [Limisphaerales bacterium]TXT47553.1 MAG: gluconolactonase [Limisphaerales bacterium]
MHKPLSLLLAVLAIAAPLRAADDYKPGPDSLPQPGVPKGELVKGTFDQSKVFPGTVRDYTVYLPTQLDRAKPAPVMVLQDGGGFSAPTVFDNLIHKKEIPALVGVFVMHGRVKAPSTNALDRFNRSYEYDGLGGDYAKFLLDELLPFIEAKHGVKLSKNGTDRAIGGASSGAIAAFTAAWERPEAFTRVFSAIGTYVGLRGGNVYPTILRKYEPKAIRVYLQDGSADQNIYGGDWWMANLEMERALKFAGYEVEHAWGDGGHNGKHATAIFPDALRWLWKDWPALPKAGLGSPQLKDILVPGADWQLVGEGYKFTEGPTANAAGEVFYNEGPSSTTYKVGPDGKPVVFLADSKKGDGQRFGPDGRLYSVAAATTQILAWDAAGKATVIADGFKGNDLVVANNGNIYVTEPNWTGANTNTSKVWLIKPSGEKKIVDTGLKFSNGVTLSPDQTLLYVADSRSHWVYSYQIKADGTLQHKQRYFHLHMPDTADDSGADGLRTDRDGRLWVATRLGLQVCDQAGRVNCIIPTPNGKSSNLTFGGPNGDVLYVTAGDKVFRRQVKVKGADHAAKPIKPAAPRL